MKSFNKQANENLIVNEKSTTIKGDCEDLDEFYRKLFLKLKPKGGEIVLVSCASYTEEIESDFPEVAYGMWGDLLHQVPYNVLERESPIELYLASGKNPTKITLLAVFDENENHRATAVSCTIGDDADAKEIKRQFFSRIGGRLLRRYYSTGEFSDFLAGVSISNVVITKDGYSDTEVTNIEGCELSGHVWASEKTFHPINDGIVEIFCCCRCGEKTFKRIKEFYDESFEKRFATASTLYYSD